MMLTVTASRRVPAAADDVWRVLDDFGNFHRTSPFVECSPVTNGVARGIGAERECRFYDGSIVRERITGYRPGQSLDIAITDSTLPIRDGCVSIQVDAEDSEHSRLTFDVTFTPRLGWLGMLLGRSVMKPVLKSRFNLIIRGIVTYIATGQTVGPSSRLLAV